MGDQEVVLTKQALGLPDDKKFFVPQEVFKHFRLAISRGAENSEAMDRQIEFREIRGRGICQGLGQFLGQANYLRDGKLNYRSGTQNDKPIATRKASEIVINALAPVLPGLIGGSADLARIEFDLYGRSRRFPKRQPYWARNINFGIREHGMGAVLNGIALTAPFNSIRSDLSHIP